MNLAVFLCSALIVSVACIPTPKLRKKQSNHEKCIRSLLDAYGKLGQHIWPYRYQHQNKYFEPFAQSMKGIEDLVSLAWKANSTKLSRSKLFYSDDNIKIVCSKEINDKAREIFAEKDKKILAINARKSAGPTSENPPIIYGLPVNGSSPTDIDDRYKYKYRYDNMLP